MSTTLDTKLTGSAATASSKKWHIGLWVAQIALAALFAMGAIPHSFMSPTAMVEMGIAWVATAPLALIRFIGFAEIAGVLGLILPAATRIMPKLTVYAAGGLLTIQALAIPFHVYRGELAPLPFNFILVALAVLIIWGRTRKAPILPRS